MFRSVLAVLAGFMSWGLVCVVSTAILMAVWPSHFREDGGTYHVGMNLLILMLTVGYSIIAGYVTATIAPRWAIRHVLALAILNLLVGIAVQSQYWDAQPVWYHLVFLSLLIPGILLGGKIRLQASWVEAAGHR